MLPGNLSKQCAVCIESELIGFSEVLIKIVAIFYALDLKSKMLKFKTGLLGLQTGILMHSDSSVSCFMHWTVFRIRKKKRNNIKPTTGKTAMFPNVTKLLIITSRNTKYKSSKLMNINKGPFILPSRKASDAQKSAEKTYIKGKNEVFHKICLCKF